MPKSGGKWKRAASRSFVPRNFYGERRGEGAFALSLCPRSLGDCTGVRPPLFRLLPSIRHAVLHLCRGAVLTKVATLLM